MPLTHPAVKAVVQRPEFLALGAVLPVLLLLPGDVPLGIYALGLVSAAPIALHAAGIILVFRSNRFINFAQLQIGAVAGTLFALLVNARPVLRGVSAACPPCLQQPGRGLLQANYWFSLTVAVLLAVGLGWLTYVVVVRRLNQAPRLVATVASIFLITLLAGVQRGLVLLLTTEDQRTFGGVTKAVPLTGFTFSIGPARFGPPDVLMVVVALAALIGVSLYLRRSASGTAIRASAENAPRAQTLGIDVVKVTGRVWMLVGLLSGAAALIAAMTQPAGTGENPAAASSLVRILAVVVVARLVSLPLAGAAAVALGVLTAAVQFSTGGTNVLDGTLVVVISVLLLLQRRAATRADVDTSSAYLAGRQARPVPRQLREVPSVRSMTRSGIAALVAVLLIAPFVLSPSQTNVVTTTCIYAVVGMSLLVLSGWAGLVSLGQFGFAAVGAYAAAVSGLPFLPALVCGGLAGAAVAVLVGLPALRLRPLTLAISTLAFAAAVPAVLLAPDLLGGPLDRTLRRPLLLGIDLEDQRAFYFFSLVLLVLTVLAVLGLRRSRTARALLAARDNEPAALAFGINVLRARLQAFALSGFIAAFAGALFAFQQAGVRADSFSVEQSLLIFMFTVIGGLGSVGGPLLGFAVLALLSLFVTSPTVAALVNGLGGVALLLLAPGGLAQVALDVRDALMRRIAARHAITIPGLGERDRLPGDTVAPISPKLRPGGGAVFIPRRYALEGQWALSARAVSAGESAHD
ncbi:MAG TPA: ABC transporter permease [Acidimicrobiales bacterium]|nr:ABC transporter permease [Acidimicrobiales bacterium]